METVQIDIKETCAILWLTAKEKWLGICDCPLKQAEHNYSVLKQRVEGYEARISNLAHKAFSQEFSKEHLNAEDRRFRSRRNFTPLDLGKWQLQREIYQAYGRMNNVYGG